MEFGFGAILGSKLKNFFICSRFLRAKLIARKCKDIQPLRGVLIMQLDKLGIIGVRHTSLGSYIDKTQDLSLIFGHVNNFSAHRFIHERVEILLRSALVDTKQQSSADVLNSVEKLHDYCRYYLL